jgi:predicted transcriptional regulator
MNRYTRKALVLDLLEKRPATTGEISLLCDCATPSQAYGSLLWLEKCGAIVREAVVLKGRRMTSRWHLAI